MVVDVTFEERYWYPEDGGVVWVAGYQLVDPESGRYLGRDDPLLAERRLVVTHVAGAAANARTTRTAGRSAMNRVTARPYRPTGCCRRP